MKDQQTLANGVSATFMAPVPSLEMGTFRKRDANNDKCVTVVDFSVVRGSYGNAVGDPGHDARADFNHDTILNVSDYNLPRSSYGLCGAPAIPSGKR